MQTEGWEAGEIIWPAPEPLPVGPLTNYGFSNEVLLPIPVTVPDDFEGTDISIKADAYWLVCEEICIPESGKLELSLRVNENRLCARARHRAGLLQCLLQRLGWAVHVRRHELVVQCVAVGQQLCHHLQELTL